MDPLKKRTPLNLLFMAGWLLLAPYLSSAGKSVLKKLDHQSFGAFSARNGAYLDVRVKNRADLIPALRLYTGDFDSKPFPLKKYKITKINASRAFVPYLFLSQGYKRTYLKLLWPKDKIVAGKWHHRVIYDNETLWTVSQLFTGFGNNYKTIRKTSGLRSSQIRRGTLIKIPESMLLKLIRDSLDLETPLPEDPLFAVETELKESERLRETREVVPVVSAPGQNSEIKPPPKPKVKPKKPKETPESKKRILQQLKELKASRQELRHGVDRKGRYGEYRLKAGEAIYSSVVVRFCGLVRAADVRRVAATIIERNQIRDETDLPVGKAIRIPYDLLEPEFKTEDDSEYVAYLKNLEEVSRLGVRLESKNLDGVYLILDSGHGGRDPGANRKRVWEDDYVYDIVCRVKQRLERETSAVVIPTVLDPSVNYQTQDVAKFRRDQDEVLTTQPPYRLDSRLVSTDGVNLRWMLANSRYHALVNSGVKPDNILFASFHADALHRTIRGSMVYVPDARVFPRQVKGYNKFKNYKEYQGNQFSFSRKSMQKAQARSLNFAHNYIAQSTRANLRIHRQKPIRSLIYRDPHRPFVPAVLKYNRIPTRVLIEVCNLNNKSDQDLLRKHSFRQKVADAFVNAVYQTYGVPTTKELTSMAKAKDKAKGDGI